MNTFKEMVMEMVATANLELSAEQALESTLASTQIHKSIDKLASQQNEWNAFERMASATTVNVMSGYDRKYMDNNDFRFAHKTYHKSQRDDNSAEYMDYLMKSVYGESASVKERKVIRESYDFDMTHTEDRLPWKKVAKTATPSRALVKKVSKSLPQASYLPSAPSASTTKFTTTEILQQDGKTSVYTADAKMYTVVDYKIYKQAVILDIVPVDTFQSKRWFEDEILGLQQERIDTSRDSEEVKEVVNHLVFRYAPLTKDGKPNRYCGLRQLKDWLHSIPFIKNLAPATLGDALEILRDCTVTIPNAIPFNFYSEKSDNFTVYTVFGDFDFFREQFEKKSTLPYQPISEYSLRDKDSYGTETLAQTIYAKVSDSTHPLLKYDCHKEFNVAIPLTYSHISAIFD